MKLSTKTLDIIYPESFISDTQEVHKVCGLLSTVFYLLLILLGVGFASFSTPLVWFCCIALILHDMYREGLTTRYKAHVAGATA